MKAEDSSFYRSAEDYFETDQRGEVLLSSKSRAWTNIEVVRARHCLRRIVARTETNIVALYVGKPSAATYYNNGRRHNVVQRKGGVSILPATTLIDYECDGRDNEDIFLHLETAFLVRTALECDLKIGAAELVPKYGDEDSQVVQTAIALWSQLESRLPGERLFADSAATLLAVHLLRKYGSIVPSSFREYRGGLAPAKLRRATEFINEHLEQNMCLREIAAATGMSEYYFARLFKQSTGLAPHQYVLKQRVDRAKQLLIKSELPLVEIGLATGFQSQSHFTKVFGKFTGIPPSKYREDERNGS